MRRFGTLLGFMALGFAAMAWAQTPAEFKGHQGLIYNLAFSPDGKVLATASFDNTVKLWDYATGKEIAVLKGHTSPVYAVAFSSDGTIATGGADNLIKIWDKAGKHLRDIKGHTGIVQSLAFSQDGKTLASGSADKTVRLWNPGDGKEIKNLGAHKETVYSVAFSPKGELLASGSMDTTIKIWDVKAGTEKKMIGTPPKEPEKVDPKKKAKDDKKKDEKKKEEVKKEEPKKEILPPPELPEGVTGVLFTPDGSQVLAIGMDNRLKFYSVADGKELKKLPPAPDWLFGIALSRDGKQVATAGYGGSLRVYDLASGKDVFSAQLQASDKLKKLVTYCVQFTPDGKALVTGHEKDNAAKVTPLKK